jgi:hypothetical protein
MGAPIFYLDRFVATEPRVQLRFPIGALGVRGEDRSETDIGNLNHEHTSAGKGHARACSPLFVEQNAAEPDQVFGQCLVTFPLPRCP